MPHLRYRNFPAEPGNAMASRAKFAQSTNYIIEKYDIYKFSRTIARPIAKSRPLLRSPPAVSARLRPHRAPF